MRPWGTGVVFAGGLPPATILPGNGINGSTYLQWLNSRGDTVRTVRIPRDTLESVPVRLLARRGYYYVAGISDGAGTGQTKDAPHYSLLCTDTTGALQWARSYPNNQWTFTGGGVPQLIQAYSYTSHLCEAPRNGLLISGSTQVQGYGDLQFQVIETDSVGRVRRVQAITPQGTGAGISQGRLWNNTILLRDGSGYVMTASLKYSNEPTRNYGLVMKFDTALQVVWQYRLDPPANEPQLYSCKVYEQPDGTLLTLYTTGGGRTSSNRLQLLRLSAQGQRRGLRTYCTQTITDPRPYDWQPLPDSSFVVAGRSVQASPQGNTFPAFVARFYTPCPTVQATAVPVGRGGLAPYPQPATAGQAVQVPWQRPAGRSTQVALRLLDALGREVLRQPLAGAGGTAALALPARLSAGLYVVQLLAGEVPAASSRLLVQAP
ncbi:hypothetical protein [Hymenobacter sediminicola]|uniref:T9SS type A sorting domain-containing protein n=2 Tax=Hymenobacter TaxID=89966 RepID=A0A7G7WBS3_9BACT|nr:hypothetical protein [Hymenobacter sediminicola]QNH63816.1 hypothetical protein H4317_08485 [Hymenobacter sediminicola]